MLKKDYIQRQFEDFGKVLGLILGYKKGRDWEKFEKEIADAAKKFTSREISSVEDMTEESFGREIVVSASLDQQQKTILAALLFEKMNYYIELGELEQYLKLKNRCLSLYRHIRENFTDNEFNLDVHYKLEFLSQMSDL